MRHVLSAGVAVALLTLGAPLTLLAGEALPGASVEELLVLARQRNPEYAGMRFEAQAALERVLPAGALPDPKFRTEWMDVTRMGQQKPTLLPNNVGSVRYTLMQDLPWFGKRDLKREIAELDAEGSQGKLRQTWSELETGIKTAQAQRQFLAGSEKLTRELLDLIARLEGIAQVRYANGLSAQQDVIRAQIEQTSMKNELVALESERRQVDARLNALLARPATAPLAQPLALRVVPSPGQLDPATLQQRVQAGNPQLFTEEARIRSASKGVDLVAKNRYPDVTLAITPTQTRGSFNEWSVMAEINIPLQQESRRAQEREAQAMLSAAQARKEAAANQVLAELSQHLAALEAAQRTEALATTSLLPQSELTFNAALAGYENGKLDFATLLEAQRQIRQARQNQIKATLEEQIRVAEIEKLLGEAL